MTSPTQRGRPILYWIADAATLAGGLAALPGHGAALAGAGVDYVQLREKSLADRALLGIAAEMRRALPRRARLLVNDRFDLAIAAGAHGVHLTSRPLPPQLVRRRLPPPALVGASCHSLAEVRERRRQGVDFVCFGPVYETASKLGYGAPLGVDALARVAQAGIPVLALGGITRARVAEVLAAGAAGIAGITVFQEPGAAEWVAEMRAGGCR